MDAHPLVDEILRKLAIAWVSVDGATPFPVWCLAVDGALYVVSGPGEQPAPGLAGATEALVTARGDHGGRVVTWPARVSRLHPSSPEWDGVVSQLASKRLNAPTGSAELIARWADECVVSQLVLAGAPVEQGATLPDASLAAPPAPTPAARPARKPFRLHRVRRH